jgi:hypothetical protein
MRRLSREQADKGYERVPTGGLDGIGVAVHGFGLDGAARSRPCGLARECWASGRCCDKTITRVIVFGRSFISSHHWRPPSIEFERGTVCEPRWSERDAA